MNREEKMERNMAPDREEIPETTFKLRLAMAGILLLLVILFDRSGKSFVGISTEQLFRAVETDYVTTLEIWVEAVKMQG